MRAIVPSVAEIYVLWLHCHQLVLHSQRCRDKASLRQTPLYCCLRETSSLQMHACVLYMQRHRYQQSVALQSSVVVIWIKRSR